MDLLAGPKLAKINDKWLTRLWLNIFNDENLTNLGYKKNFLQPNNNEERFEFLCLNSVKSNAKKFKVKNKSANNEEIIKFDLKLPFSWLIKQNLDELVQLKIKEGFTHSHDLAEDNDYCLINKDKHIYLIEQLTSVFGQTPLFENLSKFFEQQTNIKQIAQIKFLRFYLNDFLLYNCTFLNMHHLEIVIERVNNYCQSLFSKINRNSLNYLVCIHLAYDLELKQEIDLFDKFLQVIKSLFCSVFL